MIGSMEIIVASLAALLLFGPDKFLDFTRSLGKILGEFKKELHEAEISMDNMKEFPNEDTNLKKVSHVKKVGDENGIEIKGNK